MTTSDGWPYEPAAPVLADDIADPPPRPVLAAVRADLAALGDLTGGARGSLAALALYLAEVIDTRGADAPPAASARLAQELRATLVALTTENTSDPDQLAQLLTRLSSPVRDQTDT